MTGATKPWRTWAVARAHCDIWLYAISAFFMRGGGGLLLRCARSYVLVRQHYAKVGQSRVGRWALRVWNEYEGKGTR